MFPPGNQLPEQWKVAMEAKPVLEALMVLPVHLSYSVVELDLCSVFCQPDNHA